MGNKKINLLCGLSWLSSRKTIARTDDVVSRWLEYAEKCRISEERADEIKSGIFSAQIH